MKVFKLVLCVVAFVAAAAVGASGVFAAERVIVIGDEIVVDGATQPYGFVSELRRTFAEEKKDVEVVPLGVRRSTFGDWRALVAKSYEENAPTDVEGVALKDEFDKGADVVFVCLGRNDAFKPTFASPFKESNVFSFNAAPVAAAQLAADIEGLVEDLKKRTPGVKQVVLVSSNRENRRDSTAAQIGLVAEFVKTGATKTSCDLVPLNDVFEPAQHAAWFAADQIDVSFDDFRPNEYGSQLATWAFLLALSDKSFDVAYSSAKSLYAPAANRPATYDLPNSARGKTRSDIDVQPALDEWERVARRYYETRVDSRLRDAESPGFFLSPQYRVFDSDAARLAAALDTSWRYERDMSDAEKEAVSKEKDNPNKRILASVMCTSRGIEADQPLTRPDGTEVPPRGTTTRDGLDKTPKIEVVSCGALRFDRIDERRSSPGRYVLHFNGTLSDLPVDITLRVAGIEKTARLEKEPEYFVSDVSYLRQTFSSLENFPQEKAVTSVDYAALTGKDPVEYARTAFNSAAFNKENAELARNGLMKRPPIGLIWNSRLQATSQWGISKSQNEDDFDPSFVDVARYCKNESYSGVYLVRYVDVPDNQTATLKLGVKGYKTHVVERVYLNGKQLFFGELNVDDPEKQEASLPVQLKKGRNIMVARVDHTEWDWIVGFKFLDKEGNAL